MQKTMTRRGLARFLGLTGGGVLAGLHEPFCPVIVERTITLATLPIAFHGLRVLHLSDLHLQQAFPAGALLPALTMAQTTRPDLLLLTGDYIYDQEPGSAKTMAACAALLEPLARLCPLGAYCVFGNHDFPLPPADPARAPWQEAGIRPLFDEVAALQKNGETLYLIGLRSAISRPVTPMTVMAQAPSGSCRIVLWHEPDRAEEVHAAGGSLMLSGHTHGGQVVLPGVGPLRLPTQGKRYASGLYQLGQMPLYVTRGLGVLPPRIRFCCPPEITVLTLHRHGS
ncbi:MAG: metallophosphoesterase [Armatimonas sp.]